MTHTLVRRRLGLLAMGLTVALASACGGGGGNKASATTGTTLVGLLKLAGGTCQGSTAQGSYFRMVQPNGSLTSGPFVPNGDSACTDKTYSPLLPGTDGGLKIGGFQPAAGKAFDANGNALATRVAKPTKFFAVDFAVFTDSLDHQTGKKVTAPQVTAGKDGTVTGDMTAFQAAYNNAYYNQGAPKPGGSLPGNTRSLTGRYDATTHHLVLTWSSQIVGGAFNNFTGVWHLEGTFQPTG